MKRTSLFFLLIMSIFTQAQTSIYHEFPDSMARWNITSYQNCGIFFNYNQYEYTYELTGDTIVSANTYKKLESPVIVVTSNGGCSAAGTWTISGLYEGGIREDVANRKVYFVPVGSSTEQLLYDFNMQVGDTVLGYTERLAATTEVVESIDSVLIGSTYRKRWNINSGYGISFIEGIGSTFGLIAPSPGNITDQDMYMITCFQQINSVLYPDTSIQCNLIDYVSSPINRDFTLVVSPNPSIGKYFISGEVIPDKVEIYNITGLLVCNFRLSEGKSEFDLSNQSSGCYLLKAIYSDNRTIVKSLFKQ